MSGLREIVAMLQDLLVMTDEMRATLHPVAFYWAAEIEDLLDSHFNDGTYNCRTTTETTIRMLNEMD